ncbi:MAG TPA: DUF6483 family protein [Verrucomicrobiae bacterium]|nr:DUF6483 family protein [Verrucomicrobiae bacterium]
MIKSDYILRMVDELMQALARIKALRNEDRLDEAADALDAEFKRLTGEGASEITRLSETELLAKLMRGDPIHVIRQKTLALITLLKEAGDTAAAEDSEDEARENYLKALHLLLNVLGRDEPFKLPEFVPQVESLVAALQDGALPMRTQAMLMQHYERTGQFAKAEDALFAMLDAEPENRAILEFGCAFYRRLLAQSESALSAGNFSRKESEQALKELQGRMAEK